MSEFLKQFNEEFVVLTGKSFQTLIIRCAKKGDLALIVHCVHRPILCIRTTKRREDPYVFDFRFRL